MTLLTKVLEREKHTYKKVIYLLLFLFSKSESILLFRSFNMIGFVITVSSVLGISFFNSWIYCALAVVKLH
jgi:hypothetical protein